MDNIKEIKNYTRGLKVLYVEDNSIMQDSALEMFENFFGAITVANNGLEAFELYTNSSFDLIITDIKMPKMDGLELIENIRKDNKILPIIVFSALDTPKCMTSCISLNVDGYMLKPIKKDNMISVIKKIAFQLAYTKTNIIENKKLFKEFLNRDKLTNLKNYNAFLEDKHHISKDMTPIIILINIDSFHLYNELYGLGVGDEILMKFAQNLQRFSSGLSYELYRISGNEFIYFQKEKALDSSKYEEEIEELFKYLEINHIQIDSIGVEIKLSISIGVSFDIDNGYAKADMALHEARRQGCRYLGFTTDIVREENLKNNLYWREEIYQALLQKRVHAYYHPIVDKNENIIKYESLIRIKHIKEDGTSTIISPSEFLDFSKISRQYIDLTRIVINESFKTMLKHNVSVVINLTFHDIKNKEISKLLHDKVLIHNLASKTKFDISSHVIFDLLEKGSNDDYEYFLQFINKFKALGICITIDNFGLGFANISKIAAISPDYVKIDSTLMKNIDNDKHAYTLVKAVVKFAHELGIKTIAEHISSKSIFETSKDIGIDEFQGYYFGNPLEFIGSEDVK